MKPKKGNMLVVTYWGFRDALIQAYTLPYLPYILGNQVKGTKLFLVTLEPHLDAKDLSALKNSQEVKALESDGIYLLPFRYFPFGVKMILQWIKIFYTLLKLISKRKIHTIHTWCTPAGAAGYILSILTGKNLVLDSFEPHAEPMIESYTWRKNSMAFRLLFFLEKKQAKRAKGAIACVPSMRDYSLKNYGHIPPIFAYKPACVDLEHFSIHKCKNEFLVKKFEFENKIVCVYAGKFGGSYLGKETFDFFKVAFDYWGDKFRVLLLSSHSDAEIVNYCQESNLPVEIVKKVFVPHNEVPEYMGLGDFGITPFVPVPSKRYGSPIKTGEYLALGLPVVITKDISDDSDQISKYNAGYVLKDLDKTEYLNSVKTIDEILANPDHKNQIRGIAVLTRDFKIAQRVYNSFYRELNK